MKTQFDVSVDFEAEGELEAEITKAFEGHDLSDAVALHVPADGNTVFGEIVSGESEFSCEICSEDWVVFTGPGRENLVEFFCEQLRSKL